MRALLEYVGRMAYRLLIEAGQMVMMLVSAMTWLPRPPLKLALIFKQMEFVGVKSTTVVMLTGASTGAVLALQTYYGFSKFNAETIRNIVEIYTNRYVICPVCGRPDTHMVKDRRLTFLQCDACGARIPVARLAHRAHADDVLVALT